MRMTLRVSQKTLACASTRCRAIHRQIGRYVQGIFEIKEQVRSGAIRHSNRSWSLRSSSWRYSPGATSMPLCISNFWTSGSISHQTAGWNIDRSCLLGCEISSDYLLSVARKLTAAYLDSTQRP